MFYRGGRRRGPEAAAPKPPKPEPAPRMEPAPPREPSGLGVRRSVVIRLLVGTVFLAGCAALVFGERGLLEVKRARRELHEVQARVRAKKEAVELLRAEVRRLESDPKALERVAREELNMAKPGEIIILLPRDPDWGRPPAANP